MKRIFFWALAHRNQRRPRVIWLAALPLALSQLLAFTSLASSTFAAMHTPTTSNLAATHLSTQTLLSDKIYTIPNSAAGCVGNLPTNHVQTCFGIIGSGKYVQEMWVSAYVRHSPITLALQMKGPNGFADYSAFVFVLDSSSHAMRNELLTGSQRRGRRRFDLIIGADGLHNCSFLIVIVTIRKLQLPKKGIVPQQRPFPRATPDEQPDREQPHLPIQRRPVYHRYAFESRGVRDVLHTLHRSRLRAKSP